MKLNLLLVYFDIVAFVIDGVFSDFFYFQDDDKVSETELRRILEFQRN